MCFFKNQRNCWEYYSCIFIYYCLNNSLCCLQIYILLQTNSINYIRSAAINLGTSEIDLFIPEEKRYLKNIPKTINSPEYKVIPKEYTMWDK